MNALSAVKRNGSAMQCAAICALVSLALVGLPLLAQSSSTIPTTAYGDYIVHRFQKTGAQTANSFDNRFVETNAFDFAQYFSHTCFRPTEYDRAGCEREFGPYWNLYETLASGQLKEILARYSYLNGADQAVTPKPVTKVSEPKADTTAWTPATPNDTSLMQKQRDARAKVLWATCQKRSSERTEAGRCYRRNIRLLDPESSKLDVESAVY